jgi:ATP-binding cassette subfamily B protein
VSVVTQFSDAIKLVWVSNRQWSLASVALLLFGAILSVAALGLLKLIIDAVVIGAANTDPLESMDVLVLLIGCSAFVALLLSLVTIADSSVGEIQADLVRDHIRRLVHTKTTEVDLEYYENAEYFNTLHRIQVDAPNRAVNILSSLIQIGRNGFMLLAIASLLFFFKWWIVFVLLLGDLPGAIARTRSAWMQYDWERKSTRRTRRASYFSILLSSRYPAQEIRLFDLGSLFRSRFSEVRKQLREEHRSLIYKKLAAESVAMIAGAVAIFIVYGYVAYETVRGELTIGDLGMYFAAIQRGRGSLKDLLFGVASFYQHSLFLAELRQFLDIKQKILEPVEPKPVPNPLTSGISMEDVSFRYPGASDLALQNVNIIARPGERIAIVGRNGSGKTTLLKLLCRLYEPESGRILADGIPLSNFAKKDWFAAVSVFLQEHGKYYLSAKENIGFGNHGLMSDIAIKAAADRSGANEVIQRLPHGYDTILGTVLEQGVELSIGEWQKIGLARTILRDAQIVILDEPTNAMDAMSEQIALDGIWSSDREGVTILISHRLSAVRLADRIYLLDKGQVIESGTHESLMDQRGSYASIFNTQSAGYRGEA